MSPAGSLGTPHVSYIISIDKDIVPPIRAYMSLLSKNKIAANALSKERLEKFPITKNAENGNFEFTYKAYMQ
jgi:hypothetical protein